VQGKDGKDWLIERWGIKGLIKKESRKEGLNSVKKGSKREAEGKKGKWEITAVVESQKNLRGKRKSEIDYLKASPNHSQGKKDGEGVRL